MPLSSASSRRLSIAALLCFVSCASAPPPATEPESLELEGEIVITGGTPDDRTVQLDAGGDEAWRLESPALVDELLKLGGHRVRVRGAADRPGAAGDRRDIAPVLLVDWYEMLPVDGMAPMIGRLGEDGDRVIFAARGTGERYVLAGPLSGALSCFSGCSVWVWGETTGAAESGEASILDVRGYGVLGPSGHQADSVPGLPPAAGRAGIEAPTDSVPADTLRNW